MQSRVKVALLMGATYNTCFNLMALNVSKTLVGVVGIMSWALMHGDTCVVRRSRCRFCAMPNSP